MTNTERLRALLDEHGIEWKSETDCETYWYGQDRTFYKFTEYNDGTTVFSTCQWNLTPKQALTTPIAATVGNAMTLDQAIEYAEKFMGDYAKLLLDESTLYVERDEPTDQHAFNIAERKEAQMARDLAEALATVGGYAITFAPTLDRPHETMVGETVYDSEGNAIGWIVNATVGVGTCHYYPDDAGFTWWDENDEEHYEEDSASYECDSASCDKCGFPMMVGDNGWFDGWDEITEWTEEDGNEHKGYVLKPRFKHCPRCGRLVTE